MATLAAMPDPITISARGVSLLGRIATSTTVVGSPAAAAETIIAQVTIPGGVSVEQGVLVQGWAAYTIGATGTSCQLRLRQTGLAGTIVADTGAMTGGHNTAGQLVADDINGLDTAPGATSVYVLTLQVAGGSGASTVSRTLISATLI